MRPTDLVTRAACALALLALAACSTPSPLNDNPALYTRLDQPGVSVDVQEALNIMNTYRANRGLSQLRISPTLTAVAQSQADAMAKADRVDHALTPDQTLKKRMERAGYDAGIAVENISAGYWTLAEAFSGWRDSRRHNDNMLRDGVTEMGIATQYRPNAKYKVFWALVMAKPADPRGYQPLSQSRPSDLFTQ